MVDDLWAFKMEMTTDQPKSAGNLYVCAIFRNTAMPCSNKKLYFG